MLRDFLLNQNNIQDEIIDIHTEHIQEKMDFLNELFTLSKRGMKKELRDAYFLQFDYTESLSPEAGGIPRGYYRIIYPVKIINELSFLIYGEYSQQNCTDKSFENKTLKICLMIILGHEMTHCVRHFDSGLHNHKADESDADFMAGGALSMWFKNLLDFLVKHELSDPVGQSYEIGYASTILGVFFEKHAVSESNDYHQPYHRMLLILSGFMYATTKTHPECSENDLMKGINNGMEAAKVFLSSTDYAESCKGLFTESEERENDMDQLMNVTSVERDRRRSQWNESSFMLKELYEKLILIKK